MNETTRLTLAGGLTHLKILEDAVADYRCRSASGFTGGYHDPIIAYTKVASSLEEAIERACAGRTAEGRKFRHDQYLNKWPIQDLYERLKKRQHLLRTARDFDDLHDRIHLLSPKGVGHLKIFNVTMRVGAYLNIDLDRSSFVYLHRGVLVGWQKMTGQRARPYRVPIGDMPAALQAMPHFMIEDFYCEYREWLRPGVLMQEPA